MSTTSLQKTIGKRAPDGAWEIVVAGTVGAFGNNGEDLVRQLAAVKPKQVRFIVYSPGGSVYDAIAVVGYLHANGIESFTEIYGYCASAATVFAAHSGPRNTSIAKGSMFLVHEPFHEDSSTDEQDVKAVSNAAEFVMELYVKSYGWSRAEAKKHMSANNGNGILWTADEAKKIGVVSEVMEMSKVAARYNNEQTPAMAENNTPKVATKVKLNLGQALQALVGKEGTEYEIDVDAAISQQLADKDAEITALKGQIETLEAAKPAEVIAPEALAEVTAKVTELTETVAAKELVIGEKAAEVVALNAQITALKAPLATKTVADNQAAAVAAMPGTKVELTQGESIIKTAMKGTNPLMQAQADMEREKAKA